MAPVIHIVLFQFKKEQTEQQRQALNDKMLGLRFKCIHPTSKEPYIKSSIGGMDNSIEGMQHGATHAFIVEFESVQDRDYYVNEDPAHSAFVKEVLQSLDKATILDFSPGVF
ncbi:hypothetical protein QQS21_003309 [Conoideocrella luteorostrata]|uniref:Stress-response A/B barrel domain-containing protein n=1 Tax=Conoideocrella luteorostrata TaxID=1105319 RepID=A0AAJ0G2B9_9HYPO|nr:hypothetical protein QQS21_003309 [Conoideocrella luteorostrata]